MNSLARIIGATAAFAAVHSALASHAAKRTTARVLGGRPRNALHRPLYIAQSFVTFGALVWYVRRLTPDRVARVRARGSA